MSSKKKYFKALTNIVLYAIAFTLLVTVVPKIVIFFIPFLIGWIISLLANPVVRFSAEKLKIKRKAGSAFVIILVIALIILAGYGIGSFLVSQGMGLFSSLPEKWPVWERELDAFGDKFTNLTKSLPANIGDSFADFGKTLEDYLAKLISKLGSPTWVALSKFAKSIPNTIISIIMCVLSAYIFTVDHNSIKETVAKKSPKLVYSRMQTVSRGLKRAVGGYIIAQIKIELWIYLILVIGLAILQIDYFVIIALGIAFLDFLPFFGAGAVMVPWAIIAFTKADYFTAIGMLVIWGFGQLVRQLIQPKIVGDSIGMRPLPTLFLLYIGFEFWGVFGMIVAVPLGLIVVSLYEEGLFDSFINSIKIIWSGVNRFRKITPEDLGKKDGKKEIAVEKENVK